jgi:hypothetical protein
MAHVLGGHRGRHGRRDFSLLVLKIVSPLLDVD